MYGESVAAFRYRMLTEKATEAELRRVFTEMADEEQGHHTALQAIADKHFPGVDFVLSPEDKELVIVGPRTFDLHDEESFRRALEMICQSEIQTGSFYAALRTITELDEIKPFLKEMADECFDHAERLRQLDLTSA